MIVGLLARMLVSLNPMGSEYLCTVILKTPVSSLIPSRQNNILYTLVFVHSPLYKRACPSC